MKWLLPVFTIYLLILSCFPCMCDNDFSNRNTQQEISKSHATGNNSKDDDCNPFCSCSCCTTPAFVYQKEFRVEPPVALHPLRCFNFIKQHVRSYNANAIWQPPKLS